MKFLCLILFCGAALADKLPANTYSAPGVNGGFNGGLNGGSNGGFNGGLNGGSNGGFNGGFNGASNGINGGYNGGGLNGGFNGGFNGRSNGASNGGYSYGPSQEELELLALGENIPGGGVAGEDYPVLSEVPFTGFACEATGYPYGYYADTAPEAGCQVFHICQTRPNGYQLDSFLCPNGTIFNQQYLVCDWWFNFDCSQAESFYSVNEFIGQDPNAYGSASALSSLYGPPRNGNGNGQNGNGYSNGRNGNGRNGNGRRNGNGSNGSGYSQNGNGLSSNGFNGNGVNGNGFNGNGAAPSAAYGVPF
ncbi:uncharacterized protein LOC143028768 [Oratosquilla oratoria]|uniref:uncharacterized protein LOC143028768 n=1 Tax=Oratosquilla oratoria TaxID=337810 RepID=UPI003F76D057